MILAAVVNLLVLGFSFGGVLGDCGDHITSSSGTIESPNYPKQYPNGQKCTWTVLVEGSVENIRISFSAFDLQHAVDGKCLDYVAIYRKQLNKDSDAVLEGKYCGDSKPQPIRIEESSLTVQFISDSDSISTHIGFSLRYEANFKDSSSVSQATAGIVAAIFCAVVFIGVGMLRCMMMGACNSCGGPNQADNHRDRHVVGTSDSYAYRADFPPSYSTVMTHPERFPTPESSPLMVVQNRNGTVVTDGQPRGASFSLQSSDSSSSDEDDDSTPPPPYPGLDATQDEVNVDVAIDNTNNTTDNQPNTGSHNAGVVIDEGPFNEPVSSHEVPSSEVEDEQRSTIAGSLEVSSDLPTVTGLTPRERDNSWHRGDVELSQTDGPPEETEMVFIV
ncbi:hypothetical protein ACROYT_G007611 [Oculina patagonica]